MTTGRNHPTAADLLEAAQLWLEVGWHPIPLTGRDGKAPRLEGLIGREAVDLTPETVADAFAKRNVGALGLRMPEGVLGLDVDGYDGKAGPETLAALCQELGVTLPSAPRISGRLDGRSGISFYRVPPGLDWTASPLNALGGGVDLIHRNHRHAKAWPSIHHSTGMPLGRLDIEPGAICTHDDGGEPWLLPEPDELPDLPPELVAALTERRTATGVREALTWVNERGLDHEWARPVHLAMAIWWGRAGGSRFEAMRQAQVALVRLDSLGQAGATAALRQLRSEYVAEVPERDAEGEYDRALQGALAKVATSESYRDEGRRKVKHILRRLLDRAESESRHPSVMHITTVLPDAFWESRPHLAQIRQAARARRRSPDAVLGAVLARLAAILPPLYRIPGIVGSPSTLAFYVALVGPSGHGKTTAAAIARELLPIPTMRSTKVAEHNLGSGEGLIELYMGDIDTGETNSKGSPITERGRARDGVVIVLDEGQALSEMGTRKGTTMLPTVRSMWTGGPVGQANAQKENTRKLEPGSYTLGLIIGIQPALAADLLQDTAAGTPQRFLWGTVMDPGAPAQRPPWPGQLTWRQPPLPRDGRESPELILHPDIIDEIDAKALAKVRGDIQVDGLDSHGDLMRLKAAGLLAVLDGRLDVDLDDWALAGVLLDTSRAVRESVLAELKANEAQREAAADARAARRTKVTVEAAAEAEETAYTRALDQAAGAVARKAQREGRLDRRTAQQSIKSTVRKLVTVDDALAHAVEQGWLVVLEGGEIWGPGIVND